MNPWVSLLVLFPFAALSAPAFADTARFATENDLSVESIEGLAWSSTRFTVIDQKIGDTDVPVAMVSGTISSSDSQLTWNSTRVVLEKSDAGLQKFTIPVPLRGAVTRFELTAVSIRGKTTVFRTDLIRESDDGELVTGDDARPWRWRAAVQPSFTNFNETYPGLGNVTGSTYSWMDRAQLLAEFAADFSHSPIEPGWKGLLGLTAGYSADVSGQSFPLSFETEARIGRTQLVRLPAAAMLSAFLDMDYESYPILSSAILSNATTAFQVRTLGLLWAGVSLRAARPDAVRGFELWLTFDHTVIGNSSVNGASVIAPAPYSGWRLAASAEKGLGKRWFLRGGAQFETLIGDADISGIGGFLGLGFHY